MDFYSFYVSHMKKSFLLLFREQIYNNNKQDNNPKKVAYFLPRSLSKHFLSSHSL